jgi:hemoglobin
MSRTLFQKYGGFATVSRIVLSFYDRVLDSDQIGHFFEDIDMKRLMDHQTKFIASLLGGPASFTDERLHQMHAHLVIGDADFDEMARLLDASLAEHGFESADREHVIREIEARRPVIVTRVTA